MAGAGDAVADMAYFTARDEKPAEYCRKAVRNCEVYVGLIGLRYGSPVRDEPGLSYTELEFETATDAGLVRLVLLLDEDAVVPIPASRLMDGSAELRERQWAFRARLRDSGVTAATFSGAESRGADDRTAERPGTTGLPARPAVVGRDAEVAALTGAWLDTQPGAVAVLGAPGIGKSTVCLAALLAADGPGRPAAAQPAGGCCRLHRLDAGPAGAAGPGGW